MLTSVLIECVEGVQIGRRRRARRHELLLILVEPASVRKLGRRELLLGMVMPRTTLHEHLNIFISSQFLSS